MPSPHSREARRKGVGGRTGWSGGDFSSLWQSSPFSALRGNAAFYPRPESARVWRCRRPCISSRLRSCETLVQGRAAGALSVPDRFLHALGRASFSPRGQGPPRPTDGSRCCHAVKPQLRSSSWVHPKVKLISQECGPSVDNLLCPPGPCSASLALLGGARLPGGGA